MNLASQKQKFFDWGYGLMIHFGLYSVYGRGEWILYKERMNPEEYRKNALPSYQPRKGCARDWVRFAQSCGMKYVVLTTRHHDGFFIGEEILHEYCDACREFGLGVGLYYSVADWSDPDYRQGTAGKNWWRFVKKSHRQILDLMNNYGKIDYLFYDGTPPPETWNVLEFHQQIRALQPDMLITRCRADNDIISCEQNSLGGEGLWESCYTLNDSWGYNAHDQNWKTPRELARMLFANRHNGGNFLINIGPRADGSIPEESVRILQKLGRWVKKNAEAIYEIIPHPFQYADQELSTGRKQVAYLMLIWENYGPERKITGIGNRVLKLSFLDSGEKLDFVQKKDIIQLTGLNPRGNAAMPRILKIELDGTPVGIKNYMTPQLAMKFDGDRH